jgi:hypothetical protein
VPPHRGEWRGALAAPAWHLKESKRTSTALLCNESVPVCDIAGLSPGNLRGVVMFLAKNAAPT